MKYYHGRRPEYGYAVDVEKGGKSRENPVRHDLEGLTFVYVRAGQFLGAPGDSPTLRSAVPRADRLSNRISPHSFRALTVTDFLLNGVPLEDVQTLAGHSDVGTTRLYDRRQRRVTRNIVERISVTFE
jgi:site-specific recombinase XerD